jgi:hypothetical protein
MQNNNSYLHQIGNTKFYNHLLFSPNVFLKFTGDDMKRCGVYIGDTPNNFELIGMVGKYADEFQVDIIGETYIASLYSIQIIDLGTTETLLQGVTKILQYSINTVAVVAAAAQKIYKQYEPKSR